MHDEPNPVIIQTLLLKLSFKLLKILHYMSTFPMIGNLPVEPLVIAPLAPTFPAS